MCALQVIDACRRGGIARFINHSCNPNCRVEKWVVNGEIRVGIFADRFIPKGTELTIDYQYDRVGLHRQACYCGEPTCAKFIGAKKRKRDEDDHANAKNNKKRRKTVSEAKLSAHSSDEVCGVCGDGGDVIMCDARVQGKFCTRVFHPACLQRAEKDFPKR